jgi:hypothetical protein
MKPTHIMTLTFGTLALLCLALGCSTTKQTENLLSAAGFKMMPAATPEQQAHLKSLPPNKVTTVVREGQTWFAFPDRKAQVLYVGQQAQYDAYQRLRLQQQLAEDQVQASETAAGWAAWGPWTGVGVVEPVRGFRR